jgi:putative selenate reductase
MAQNILAAYLAGGRFFELKTVQTMDGEELRKCVARPCINAADEGYNVEWSTELTVEQAFEEYVKAWFLLHLFGREFGLREGGEAADFIFNQSVGYSLEGIRSAKIDGYIQGMRDAGSTAVWKHCRDYLAANLGLFRRFDRADLEAVSPAIAPGITLSTLHGCPREEIEKIADYLLREKKLHTYIKCNPTLLGYHTARRILDSMDYGYVAFDDHHFREDLQFDDAADMLNRLRRTAGELGLTLGVKITNTFPVEIKAGELPGNEMYMSGRALFPLSITVAAQLSQTFGGKLPISYSGGADYFNLAEILSTGIRPVTMATTLLKPGGYARLNQLASLAEGVPQAEPGASIDMGKLRALADSAVTMERYRKDYRHIPAGVSLRTGLRKIGSPLPLFDCATAPCSDGCPIHQQIPAYLEKVALGDYHGAFDIIARDNTAPSITGTICDHRCQHTCTRLDYEDALEIRRAKRLAAEHAQDAYTARLAPPALKTGKSVGIVGAGPGGIAAAVYLRRNGVPVTVYERGADAYGVPRRVIPSFRISGDAIDRDLRMAEKLGIDFVFNADVDSEKLAGLRKKHAFLVLAVGTWKAGLSPVREGGEHIMDGLAFLEASKSSGLRLELGKTVGIIGGGDVAMDCARAAKRNRGVEKVTVVYRRTREFMPAQKEEIQMALAEGVEILELAAPETYRDGVLTCEVQALGGYDQTGRRGIMGTGKRVAVQFHTVVGAVGARADTSIFIKAGANVNDRGLVVLNDANETSVPNLYAAGDCKAGPATVVKAMADSKVIAGDILRKLGLERDFGRPVKPAVKPEGLYQKKGVVMETSTENTDGLRCLSCGVVCEICVDVCPNRANMAVTVGGFSQARQIVHLDRLCNECGNCALFCPHDGKPYRDKFTIFSDREDFDASGNYGTLPLPDGTHKLRLPDNAPDVTALLTHLGFLAYYKR